MKTRFNRKYRKTIARKVVYDYTGDVSLKLLIERIKYVINYKLKHQTIRKYNEVFLNL